MNVDICESSLRLRCSALLGLHRRHVGVEPGVLTYKDECVATDLIRPEKVDGRGHVAPAQRTGSPQNPAVMGKWGLRFVLLGRWSPQLYRPPTIGVHDR